MRQLDTTWFRGYFWHGGTQGSPIYLAFGCWKHGIHQFGLQVWLVPAIGGAWGTEKLPETSNDTGQVHHVHLIFNHHFLLYLCLQSFICPCFEGWVRRRCPSPPSQWTAPSWGRWRSGWRPPGGSTRCCWPTGWWRSRRVRSGWTEVMSSWPFAGVTFWNSCIMLKFHLVKLLLPDSFANLLFTEPWLQLEDSSQRELTTAKWQLTTVNYLPTNLNPTANCHHSPVNVHPPTTQYNLQL